MALTACLGMDDEEIIRILPGKTDASKALIAGLHCWDEGLKEKQKELAIKSLSPANLKRTVPLLWNGLTAPAYRRSLFILTWMYIALLGSTSNKLILAGTQ